MNIISFDCGVKNLAFVIVNSDNKIIYFSKIDLTLSENFHQCTDFAMMTKIKNKKKINITYQKLAHNLFSFLGWFDNKSIFNNCYLVLIEKQMKRNSLNYFIQNSILNYFIMLNIKYQNQKSRKKIKIKIIHPKYKLNPKFHNTPINKLIIKHKQNRKNNYNGRKMLAREVCKIYLENKPPTFIEEMFLIELDFDLADSFLQCLSFKNIK